MDALFILGRILQLRGERLLQNSPAPCREAVEQQMQGQTRKQKQEQFSKAGKKGLGNQGFMQQNPVRRCGRRENKSPQLTGYCFV